MTSPLVVHCKKDPYDVLIDRSTPWGNRYVIGADGTREQVIESYRYDFARNPELRGRAYRELRGKVLGCWCAPQPCHGDVLAEYANAPRRILVTCSRTWKNWPRARAVLSYVHQRAPDAILVSGHAWKGDRDLERIWNVLGGQVETYEPDWEGPCAPECWPPCHRKRGRSGREYCPAAGDRRNEQMAQLPGVMLCLAFLAPCEKPDCPRTRRAGQHYSHGAAHCASYAKYEMRIPVKRIAVPLLSPAPDQVSS